jgi:hypothetical protein
MSCEHSNSTVAAQRCGLLFAFIVTLLALPLRAADIGSGIFVMRTSTIEPASLGYYIEQDFFGPGSDEAWTEIYLKGAPLETEDGSSLGAGDTIIQLPGGVDFPEDHVEPRMVSAQILAISLEGSQPLTVTYHGANPELWEVRICKSASPLAGSRMRIVNECGTAGTFSAALMVKPKFIFTRKSDGLERVYDIGLDPRTANTGIGFGGYGHWMRRDASTSNFIEVAEGTKIDADCDGTFETTLLPTSDTILGLERVNCNVVAPTQGFPKIEHFAIGASYALEPATQDDRTFPKEPEPPPSPSHRQAAMSLSSLALLGLAAVVIRPRRPPH